VRAGLEACAEGDARAVVVLGHADYYPRFGFSAAAAQALKAPFSGPSFMALELLPGALRDGGAVRYARAFRLDTR
jgi:putative acetyltransferase